MRVVHISDTHLGFSAYAKLNQSEGVNQREMDIYNAFEQAITKTIELRPDVVVHSGDLFDTSRPQNRAINFALNQLARLSQVGIDTVLISGNHSTPRLRETGNIFGVFEHLNHIHPVYEPGVHKVVVGDLTVAAVPHSTSPPLSKVASEAKASPETRLNILVLHASLLGAGDYRMDELNEQIVPIEAIADGFDYVAMGHFHRYEKVRGMIHYSGSTERLGFNEAGQKKGIIEVDLDSHLTRFHELRIREMVELERIDASGMGASEILEAVRERLSAGGIDDKIVRLTMANVSRDAHKSLDIPAIRRIGSSALHLELKVERLETGAEMELVDAQIGSLSSEFQRYVSKLSLSDEKKKRLMELGPPYLMEAEE